MWGLRRIGTLSAKLSQFHRNSLSVLNENDWVRDSMAPQKPLVNYFSFLLARERAKGLVLGYVGLRGTT